MLPNFEWSNFRSPLCSDPPSPCRENRADIFRHNFMIPEGIVFRFPTCFNSEETTSWSSFLWVLYVFSIPISPPRNPIGSVPSYTLSSPAIKGVTHGKSFKHTSPPSLPLVHAVAAGRLEHHGVLRIYGEQCLSTSLLHSLANFFPNSWTISGGHKNAVLRGFCVLLGIWILDNSLGSNSKRGQFSDGSWLFIEGLYRTIPFHSITKHKTKWRLA